MKKLIKNIINSAESYNDYYASSVENGSIIASQIDREYRKKQRYMNNIKNRKKDN